MNLPDYRHVCRLSFAIFCLVCNIDQADGSENPKLSEPPVVISSEKFLKDQKVKISGSTPNSIRTVDQSVNSIRFYGHNFPGNTFVFVIDNSTSMLDGHRRAKSHAELLQAIGKMKFPQKFHVIAFDLETIHIPLGPYISANSKESRKVGSWLRQLVPLDGTEPGSALRQAIGMRPDAVIFLTDGQFDNPSEKQIRAWNQHGVPIHVIDLTVSTNSEKLKNIAGDSGGSYRKSP